MAGYIGTTFVGQTSVKLEWYGAGTITNSPATASGVYINGTFYSGESGYSGSPNFISYTTGRSGFAITAEFTGLQPGTSYSFRIRSNVSSTDSGTVTATTLKPDISVSLVSRTTTAITLTLDSSPSISGKNYTITGGPSTVSGTYNGTSVVISGLSEGTSYTFTAAVSGYNNGSLTTATLSTLTAAIVPSSIRSTSVAFTLSRVGTVALPTSYTVRDISSTVVFGSTSYSAGILTISGLTKLTTYPFRIQATGFVDATPASVTTVKPLTATYVGGSATTTSLQFALSGADGIPGAVTVTNGGSPVASSISGETVTLTGLQPGTTYSSMSFVGGGFEAALPTAATTVSAFEVVQTPVSIGATSVVLQITPLGGTVMPASSTGWTITYPPAGTVASSDISFNSSSKQLRIQGLTEYTEYAFTIAVADMASQNVTVRTADITAPGSVTGLDASSGDSAVTLSWNPLSDSGSPISYIVKNLNSGVESTISGTTTTISGLSNGTAYIFSVKAKDAYDNSGAPVPSSQITPSRIPNQVAQPTFVPGASSAFVQWAAPATGGAPITSYTVRAYRADPSGPVLLRTEVVGADVSANITGLTPNTVYVFTVTATNLRGDGPESTNSKAKVVLATDICFLADAPVRVPGGGVRAIANFQVGDLVETADGRAVPVRAVSVTASAAGPKSNPYVIPRGRFGATEDLRISPNHKIAAGNGRMVEAKNLGLKQVKMSGMITYYNLELLNWETDRLVVAGVEAESLAPVRRKVVPVAEFNAMIARMYGPNPTPAIKDKLQRMCTFLPNGMVEYPFLKA